jgi:hypothetical protein
MGTKTLPILWLYTEKESIYPQQKHTTRDFRNRTDTQLLKQDSPKIHTLAEKRNLMQKISNLMMHLLAELCRSRKT